MIRIFFNRETSIFSGQYLKNEQNWMMDSVLSSADDKELNHAKEWVRQLKSTGKLREFYDNHNLVDKLGCGTVVILMKE